MVCNIFAISVARAFLPFIFAKFFACCDALGACIGALGACGDAFWVCDNTLGACGDAFWVCDNTLGACGDAFWVCDNTLGACGFSFWVCGFSFWACIGALGVCDNTLGACGDAFWVCCVTPVWVGGFELGFTWTVVLILSKINGLCIALFLSASLYAVNPCVISDSDKFFFFLIFAGKYNLV